MQHPQLLPNPFPLRHYLCIPIAQQSGEGGRRLGTVLAKVGWLRHASKKVYINGKSVDGFYRPRGKREVVYINGRAFYQPRGTEFMTPEQYDQHMAEVAAKRKAFSGEEMRGSEFPTKRAPDGEG